MPEKTVIPVTLRERENSSFDPKVDIPGQLRKILSSPHFQHSERYKNFLRFVVGCTLEGRTELLKERMIGIEVFGKTPDFDTGNDTSVRVIANEVRKRLALYYGSAEHSGELQIKIPVRSYVAEFSVPSQAQEEPLAEISPQPRVIVDGVLEGKRGRRRRVFYIELLVIVGVLLGALAWGGLHFRTHSVIDVFWGPFFNDSRSITFCISPYRGYDAEIPPVNETIETNNKTSISYNAYRDLHNGLATPDVIAFVKLSTYLQGKGTASVLRSSQNTILSDLYGAPVILIGSFHNSWTMWFEAEHRFHFRRDQNNKLRWIEDAQNPTKRDWMLDDSAPVDEISTDYLLVTRVFNQPTGQWWVSVSGLTGVGTMVGARTMADPKTVYELFSDLPSGWEKKNLQVVLGFKVVQGSPGNPRRLAYYSW